LPGFRASFTIPALCQALVGCGLRVGGRDEETGGISVHFFELRPNCSLTPRTATFFYVSLLSVTLPVAVGFAALGLWPILPFAGLELLGLGAALVVSMRRGGIRDYIAIDERDVRVKQSRGRRETEVTFARPWTRLELRPAPVATWPSRLLVVSKGRRVEVGAFLTESERRRLSDRLGELLPRRLGGSPRGGE
jgi:uncharacterized membrane protein